MGSPERTGHGTAVWSTSAWRDRAVSWVDERLAAAGIERTGPVEQPHLRPWATVLRVPTSRGTVWFKASGPGTAFEVGLYEVLARTVPRWVLAPLAADAVRGWMVLPDGGPSLGDRLAGTEMVEALGAALVQYGQLQVDLAAHVDELLAVGVADMRPPVMARRFEQALEAAGAYVDSRGTTEDRATLDRVAARAGAFAAWCDRLAASTVPASLDHNDLHPFNVLGAGNGNGDGADVRFYDWGDGVVAHSFAAMLVPLGYLQHVLGTGLDDPVFLRIRDGYLDVFSAVAPGEDLVATLELACTVAKVARALTWDRALQAARDQGEDIDDDWATAPLESLAALLDESYLGNT